VLTLSIGIGLSIFAWLFLHNWEEKYLRAELQTQLDKIAINIEKDIKGSLEVLQATSALNSSSNEMKQQDFKRFVQTYIYRHSSLQAIAWLPRTIMKKSIKQKDFLSKLQKKPTR